MATQIKELELRMRTLPLIHVYYVCNLCACGTVGMLYSVSGIRESLHTCPTFRRTLPLFYYYGVVCASQLAFAFAVLCAIIGCAFHLFCYPRTSQFCGQLYGPNGFVLTQPTIYFTNWDKYLDLLKEEANQRIVNDTKRWRLRWTPTRRARWTQPVLIITAILVLAHLIGLFWSCGMQREIFGDEYQGRIETLFEYAKDYENEHTELTIASRKCWNWIQRKLSCCGVANYTDWLPQEDEHQVNITEYVPASCSCYIRCKRRGAIETELGPINKHGCQEALAHELSQHVYLITMCAPCACLMLTVSTLGDFIYTWKTADYAIKYMRHSNVPRQRTRGRPREQPPQPTEESST